MHPLNDPLIDVFTRPRWVELSADEWYAAAIIGAMRTGVNDPIRQPRRDRDPERNLRNDTSGVLAEILVIKQVEQELPSQRLKYQLLDLEKATDMLDIQLAESEAGLEAKSVLLLEEKKRSYFAINKTAASRSARRGAMGYVGVLTAMGSRHALMSKVVPMDEVKKWPVRKLGGYGDPAHLMKLRDFALKHVEMPDDKTVEDIEDYFGRDPVVASRALEDVYWRAHAVRNVPQELLGTTHETPLAPILHELVRAVRSGGEVAD